MRAIRIHQNGGPEVLQLDEVAQPAPGPGQIRVKMEASGINFVEIYQREGLYQLPLPLALGGEGAGTVDAVGPGVTGFTPGDRVASASMVGAYAEYALAPAHLTARIPAELDTQRAAAVMLQGMTAHYLALSTFPLQAGQSALIHAAAGGVGALLVQIAKMRGARVIATVGTDEKAEIARASGADEVVIYTREDFVARTRAFSGGKGVDVVYDSVGASTFDGSLNCLRPRGMLVLYGQSSGPVAPVNPQILNAKGALFLTRPTLVHYIANREEFQWRTGDLFQWIAEGKLTVRVDSTYPLEQAAAAQTALAARSTKGKVLLLP